MAGKQNCWEFKKCGFEPHGSRAGEAEVCPAAIEAKADGIHGGKNGGRCCWAIARTLCGGRVQGSYATKQLNCMHCEFYQSVKREEGKDFLLVAEIQKKLER